MAQTVDGQSKVGLTKLLGSTIDVNAQDDPGIADGSTLFGFWTNEGDAPEEIPAVDDPLSFLVNRFEGQRLTITVTFEDGRTSTQVIELHVGTFRAERKENGAAEVTAERASEEDVERGEAMKSLYGEVVEVDDGAFPLPLDDANDRADKVLPPSMIERRDSLVRATREGSDGLEDAILAESPSWTPTRRFPSTAPGRITPPAKRECRNLKCATCPLRAFDTLPEGTDLASCVYVEDGWLGNFAYMDKWRPRGVGLRAQRRRHASGGEYRFALVSVTVRNPSDRSGSTLA